MAEKNNATCSICGKDYYMCLSCKDMIKLNPWKKYTDTSEHYKIYQILHGYSIGLYDKEDAKSKFQMVDLSDLDSFRENIKNVINEIITDINSDSKKPKRKRKVSKVVEQDNENCSHDSV